MKDNGLLPDPENLDDEVVKSFYCKMDDWWQYEHQYFKSEFKRKDYEPKT